MTSGLVQHRIAKYLPDAGTCANWVLDLDEVCSLYLTGQDTFALWVRGRSFVQGSSKASSFSDHSPDDARRLDEHSRILPSLFALLSWQAHGRVLPVVWHHERDQGFGRRWDNCDVATLGLSPEGHSVEPHSLEI